MGREQTALSWLRRYDALLREREEESRREQVVREILKAKAAEDVLPPSFHLARAEDPLGRRKRTARDTLVPIFLPRAEGPMQAVIAAASEPEPEAEPEGRMFERAERASGVVPKLRDEGVEALAPVEALMPVEALAPVEALEALEPREAAEPVEPREAAEPVEAREALEPVEVREPLEALAPENDDSIDVVLEESMRPLPVAPVASAEALAAPVLAEDAVPAQDVAFVDAMLAQDAAPEDAISAEPPEALAEALAFVTRPALPPEEEEPAPLPELAMAAVGAWSSIPPPPVDDATTDAMAMPPAFTRPPPRITVLGPPPMDETTEPMEMGFPQEPSLPIDLSPLGLSPLGVSPRGMSPVALSPVAPAEASGPLLLSPPPAPRLAPLELSPPPLEPYRQMPNVSRAVELTPPSLPLAASASAVAAAALPAANPVAVAPLPEPIPLPVFDLKNPWANDDAAKPAPPPAPTLAEKIAPWKPALRTLSLALVAATVGITVRGGLALREKTPAPLPPAPIAAPVTPAAPAAPSPVAPNEPTALGAKVQGTLEITAGPDVPIVVDGIERGRGPKLSLPLGTGYHMVRVGSGAAQLVQIRTKQTTGLDLTKP